MYKVKKSDLIGEIKDFPIEVVQKMVEKQVHQGNKADVKKFQEYKRFSFADGGFYWGKTKEGQEFWYNVIDLNDFDLFFKKYPKKEEKKEPLNESKKAIKDIDVMPKFIWDKKRIDMIKDGIKRYIDANKAIPVDWTAEYNELVKGKG